MMHNSDVAKGRDGEIIQNGNLREYSLTEKRLNYAGVHGSVQCADQSASTPRYH